MAKKKATMNWKETIVMLKEIGANVPSKRLAEYFQSKGVEVTSGTIGAIRANITRGARLK